MERENEFEQDLEVDMGDESEEEQENEQEEEEQIPESLPEGSLADEPDPGDDEEEEEEPEPEEEEKPKKRDKAQTRINQIQREKYQAQHQAELLRQENEELKRLYDLSADANVRQYEGNVAQRLEKARQMQIRAIEEGDPNAQADANMELAAAMTEMQQLNSWKSNQEYARRQAQYQEPAAPYAHNIPNLQAWTQENDWFNPDSENFDEELATNINQYSEMLNDELVRHGYADRIMSPVYFEQINEQARLFIENRDGKRNVNQRRDLNMKPVRGGASPVRGANAPQSGGGKRTVTITPDERDMARRMGVSDKTYLQYRLKDEQENAIKRRGGY